MQPSGSMPQYNLKDMALTNQSLAGQVQSLDKAKKEVDRELAMRRKVWKTIPGQEGVVFVNMDHQRQYDTLHSVYLALTQINPQEFCRLVDQALALPEKKPEAPQGNLFGNL